MNKTVAITLGILVIIGIGISVYSPKQTEVKEELVNNTEVATQTETNTATKNVMDAAIGTYETYAPEKLSKAETGRVVLFFHASWCPTCRALNSNIEASKSIIPADVTILKTDYDTETELKKKYGVTTQHTLVQVDKDGNMLTKWSGGSTIESIISKLK